MKARLFRRARKEPLADPVGPYGTVYSMAGARWRRRTWAVGLLACMLLVAVIGVIAVVIRRSPGPQVGDCAAHGENDNLQPVACGSSEAFGRVTKLTPEKAFGLAPPDCPDGTDSFSRIHRKGQMEVEIACIRNLAPPHPGDPGAGGGGLIAGDCIDVTPFVSEVACSAEAGGHVAARTGVEGDCPKGTLDVVTLDKGPRSVLCLDSGSYVLAPGDCIADPSGSIALFGSPKVPCDSEDRFAEVVGRAPVPEACPPTTRLTTDDKAGAAGSRTICLQ